MPKRKRKSETGAFDESVPPPEDTLALSFLDVLSCGLGGSICLFLIFSVMPHIGQAGAGKSVRTDVIGDDNTARTAGAKFEDWDDVVENATICIVVAVTRNETVELPTGTEIPDDQIVFRDLPRNATVSAPTGDVNALSREWIVLVNNGLRPPDHEISCHIKNEKVLHEGYRCSVRVTVSGGGRQSESLALSATHTDERALFTLSFVDTTWIKPTPTPTN